VILCGMTPLANQLGIRAEHIGVRQVLAGIAVAEAAPRSDVTYNSPLLMALIDCACTRSCRA
jgi:hypothetical protein